MNTNNEAPILVRGGRYRIERRQLSRPTVAVVDTETGAAMYLNSGSADPAKLSQSAIDAAIRALQTGPLFIRDGDRVVRWRPSRAQADPPPLLGPGDARDPADPGGLF